MVLDVLAMGLAAVCLASVGLALIEYVRGRRFVRAGRASFSVAVVVAGDPESPMTPALLRSVAVSEVVNPPILSLAYATDDAASREALSEVGSLLDPSRVRVHAADPPLRAFPAAWHQARAAEAVLDPAHVLVTMDPCARPATRDLGPIASAVAASDALDAAAACPMPAPGASSPLGVFMGRLTADLAPVLLAAYGPTGLLPVCVALRRESLSQVLRDPLSANRPGVAFCVLMSTPRSRVVLLPRSVGALASGRPRSLRDALCDHLAILARQSPARTVLVGMGLAALPWSLLAAVGSWTLLSRIALIVSFVARSLIAATWTRSVQGGGPALASIALAPLRDLVALGFLVRAVFRKTLRFGGRLFRIRQGGMLVPAGTQPRDVTGWDD